MDTSGRQSEDNSPPWFCNPLFNSYWRHYEKAWGWFRRHNEILSQSQHTGNPDQNGSPHHYKGRGGPRPEEPFPRGAGRGSVGLWQNGLGEQHEQIRLPKQIPGWPGLDIPSDHTRSHSANPFFITPDTTGQWFSETHREQASGFPCSKLSLKKMARIRKKREKRKKVIKERAKQRQQRHCAGNDDAGEKDSSGSNMQEEEVYEMEITPEMKEFFAQSAKHKQERAALQQKELNEEWDYINLSEVTVDTKRTSVNAPTERPGLKRTEEMKHLYGAGAAMIHGMETALQLNFDRNHDMKTPKLWPQIPINITFHS